MELEQLLSGSASVKTRQLNCKGCENNCTVTRYDFGSGRMYYSGNRCEKVFSNGPRALRRGEDACAYKNELLFSRAEKHPSEFRMRIGIPRVLNMFEDFPFWHTLLVSCGFDVVLSAPSSLAAYEKTARLVMSDNICFPAKLVHSHVADLLSKGVDRIFLPFVVYNRAEDSQNSYNCPIVSGYSQVVEAVQDIPVPFDSPVFSFRDPDLFDKKCKAYLAGLGVGPRDASVAIARARVEQQSFVEALRRRCESIVAEANGSMVILLSGRPYHVDPLIQHKAGSLIASLGVDVITDDIARVTSGAVESTNFLSQWSYPHRILKAASWCAKQDASVQMVELTSFGCGPDAFLTDAVRDMLMRHGKSLTLVKLDDIDNIGSMRLRIRSLLDSLSLADTAPSMDLPFMTTPPFKEEDKPKTILAPFFTPFLSPFIPACFSLLGYKVVNLPVSDESSAELGLRYANNEVCYPATLVAGDMVKALRSGSFDLADTAVAITQTGGQCRASNYLGLIKKALVDAGFGEVPVISFSIGSGIENEQPGFRIDWMKLMPAAIDSILFSDTLARLYYPAKAREKEAGAADSLKDSFLSRGTALVRAGKASSLPALSGEAARAFAAICDDRPTKKVGIVGEIYLKFNPFAHRNLPEWLIGRGVEVVPPVVTDFFIQYFVNRKTDKKELVDKPGVSDFVAGFAWKLLRARMHRYFRKAAVFPHFVPFGDIFREASVASRVITLSAQFGEGWLLPGEIGCLYEDGVKNILSLQPFGCIANHIVSRGMEKKVKDLYPDLNLLSIDFDSGVSDVNIINRMLLFLDNLK